MKINNLDVFLDELLHLEFELYVKIKNEKDDLVLDDLNDAMHNLENAVYYLNKLKENQNDPT